MFEKNLRLACLLDFYGEVLSERQQSVLSLYYHEDLSLAEIATEIGISRQGVRDIIKKTEEELFFYEEKLGLAKKLKSVIDSLGELEKIAVGTSLPEPFYEKLAELKTIVSQ